jgi:outer membrane protein assembly factor BamB
MVALEDSVVVSNEAGAVLRLDKRGEPVWRVKFAHEVAARPTVSGSSVIVGTVGGELASLGLADAAERWRVTGELPVLTALVSDATSVYVLGPDGAVRAYALDTGKARWRRPPPRVEEARVDSGQRLPAPVLVGEVLVVALGEAGLVGLSTETGFIRWRRAMPQVLGMTQEADTVYVTTRTGRVTALSAADGSPRWEQTPGPQPTSPPTYAQGSLWVGAEPARLLELSPTDGKQLSETPLPAPLVTQLAVHGELLLVPTSGREGLLLGLRRQVASPIFSLRADTPLRTPPIVMGAQLFVLGLDGRVLSWSIRTPEP